jgi:hypothetical protein
LNTHFRTLLAFVVFAAAIVPAVAFAAAPSNDNFAAAVEIPAAGGTVTGSNVDATAETGEPDHANSTFGALHSVWYQWTAPADGPTTVDTCGSGFNTRLGVYTGSAVNALTEVANNDNASPSSCGQPLFAALSFNATAGTTYRIAVDTMGGVPDDVSGPPQGNVQLALDGPDVPPPADDGKTVPGTPVVGKTIQLRVPDLNPSGTAFTNALSIVPILDALRKDGLTYTLDADPFPSKEAETSKQRTYLREKGFGGEIIRGTLYLENQDGSSSVALQEGALATIDTAEQRLEFVVDFFHPEEDKKWLAQEKADLERNARDRLEAERRERERQEAKSKCLPIAAGESTKQIEARFPKSNSPFTTFSDAIELFSKLGCDLVIDKYVRGKPSAPHSYVKDVMRTDAKLKTIYLSLAQPGSHDFVFTIRENPAEFVSQATKANIPIGTDGKLTVSKKQLNRVTVQVIERASGRLVAGIPVTFIGAKGDYVSQLTDGDGETTFTPKVTEDGEYRLSAEFGEMEGYRTVRAQDRNDAAFTSMAGRRITRSSKGIYGGANQAELDFAKSLPVVPTNLGTGRVGEVGSIPVIQQATVTTVQPGGDQFTGPHNTVALPDDSQVLVGAAPGLIAAAGGDSPQAARRLVRAGIPNPLDFLKAIVSPLTRAIDQGVANIRTALTVSQQALIAQTSRLIGQAGGNLISDKGLGVISTGGGNLIGQAGGNLISDKGLGVISVGGGNLIGQAGGNLISDKGLGVISTGGGNLVPVFGGRVISTGGGN